MTSTDFAPALADIRAGFEIPPDKVYLDGNSLGPLHRDAREKTLSVLQDEWGDDLIAGWNKHDWINLPLTVGNQVARLVGANPGEVLCCDNLSINLFKALAAALQLNTPRTRIVTEATHFPTDNYIAEGLAQLLGPGTCRVDALPLAEIEQLDFSDVAVLSLAHVDFRTGHRRNLPALT
ncbi:MAG: kynureninase, partial [Luminiphilus sp.]